MKRILTILFILFLTAINLLAKDYYPVSIHLKDGSVKEGLAEVLVTWTFKPIKFKSHKKAKKEKIEASQIEKVVYSFKDGDAEYVPIKVYAGVKQIKIKGPFWVRVVEKGIVTTYCIYSTVEGSVAGNYTQRTSASFTDYYIMREGEPAAKMILKSDPRFKKMASQYFSDYPELASKINNDTIEWKDYKEIVAEYNSWAEKQ